MAISLVVQLQLGPLSDNDLIQGHKDLRARCNEVDAELEKRGYYIEYQEKATGIWKSLSSTIRPTEFRITKNPGLAYMAAITAASAAAAPMDNGWNKRFIAGLISRGLKLTQTVPVPADIRYGTESTAMRAPRPIGSADSWPDATWIVYS